MDINTDAGFALAVLCILRVTSGGLVFFACQCSSWVWMSRSQSKRSHEDPMGGSSRQFVSDGNKLNNRCAIWRVIAHLCGVHWIVEQPGSSVFFRARDVTTAI
eukprot:7760192-Pyramimonas_sp.AAC.1